MQPGVEDCSDEDLTTLGLVHHLPLVLEGLQGREEEGKQAPWSSMWLPSYGLQLASHEQLVPESQGPFLHLWALPQ